MSLEITQICAEVSHKRHENHYTTIYKQFSEGFEVLKTVHGIATIANTFTEDSNFTNDDERRDTFWKLKCAVSCTRLTVALLEICKRLVDKGVTLVHQGCKVTNLFALNGGLDISGLKDLTLRTEGLSKDENYETRLFWTINNQRKTSTFPQHIIELLDRVYDVNCKEDGENWEKLADFLKIPKSKFVPYWWACFTLENGTSIHVDLCGPAYGLCSYEKTLSGDEAPVLIITVRSLRIIDLEQVIYDIGKKYPHKLYMTTHSIKDGIFVKLPSSFRPFIFADKINMEITPTDAMLERNSVCRLENTNEIVDLLFLYCLQCSLNSSSDIDNETNKQTNKEIYTKISGIKAQKELNGQVLKVHSLVNDRLAVVKKDGDIIKVLPSKTLLVGGQQSQIMTLKEMKAFCDSERNEASKEYDNDINEEDIVIIVGLTKGKSLNGLKGKVIKDCRKHISTILEDDRFVIQLSETKEQKSIARKNLKFVEKGVVSDKQKIKQMKDYLTTDPRGQLFFQRILITHNFAFSALTDPEILPAFKKLVQMGLGSHVCGSLAQQQVFEQMIDVTKMEGFAKFRTVMQMLRSGITPDQYERLIGSNPQVLKIYEKCQELGILKPPRRPCYFQET